MKSGETPVDGLGVEITRSRVALYEIWRVDRVGGSAQLEAKIAGFGELARLARERNVLRLTVGLVERDTERRRALVGALRELGFAPAEELRYYTATSIIDLTKTEEELLAEMRPSARRHLRAMQRRGYRIERLEGSEWVPHLDRVSKETWHRTGGHMPEFHWDAVLETCRNAPEVSTVLGLLDGNRVDHGPLLAFGWGCGHGDHSHYAAGGSVRRPGDNAPLTYALLWSLMRWAAGNGSTWFDFGGLPGNPQDLDAAQRLKDIARFKRSFGGEEWEVGEEWSLTPRRTIARAARALGGLARRLTS